MSYVERQINITFQIGKGAYGESGYDTIKLEGLRVSASIEILGFPAMNRAQLRIYGMTLADMNQLSRAGFLPNATRKNSIAIEAGDYESGMALVYQGTLGYAFTDLIGAPDVSFVVQAWANQYNAMRPIPPTSYPGTADVATIMSGLATQMGLAFENNGVNVKLANPYFPGTPMQQVQSVARAAGIYAGIDSGQTGNAQGGVLFIVPKGGTRGGTVPVISPATGMIGYPNSVTPGWVTVRTEYNPTIRFMGQINVQSSIQPVCGLWRARKITHTLESQMPSGAWFSEIEAGLFDRPGISLNV